ncbi:membrane protein [Allocatelliglobosispora scoriae]|uniref:Membrane protein n=1 Tax=Allocatelliglobosispora scoriae TaxID=643052 RepID=A0A841BVW9_9ACTN|nr:YihY/virulence factor BrkB family protein [Allocatelliglobosispora scoriae]MBB5873247.1 membrane protein [Allocatelliglobosispora scoriae]
MTHRGGAELGLAKRVWAEAKRDNLGLLAAGVAFYALLAIFPMTIALITIYGLVADPSKVVEQIEPMTKAMPAEAAKLFTDQLTAVAGASSGSLTLGLVISLVAAVWAAAGGMSALITGINAVNDQEEQRGFVKLKGLALGLTFGGLVVAVAALLLVAVFPATVDRLHLGTGGRIGAEALRWIVLAMLIGVALSIFYWVGPSTRPKWRWLSTGAVVALVIWVVGSVAFSFYVSNFGSYNKTYGALAAVVILMLWLYLSAYIILLGAEVDAERARSAQD